MRAGVLKLVREAGNYRAKISRVVRNTTFERTVMIQIHQSQTADTRTCDFANTSKETLLASSRQHIGDVGLALAFFQSMLMRAAVTHDTDKLTDIDGFVS